MAAVDRGASAAVLAIGVSLGIGMFLPVPDVECRRGERCVLMSGAVGSAMKGTDDAQILEGGEDDGG